MHVRQMRGHVEQMGVLQMLVRAEEMDALVKQEAVGLMHAMRMVVDVEQEHAILMRGHVEHRLVV